MTRYRRPPSGLTASPGASIPAGRGHPRANGPFQLLSAVTEPAKPLKPIPIDLDDQAAFSPRSYNRPRAVGTGTSPEATFPITVGWLQP